MTLKGVEEVEEKPRIDRRIDPSIEGHESNSIDRWTLILFIAAEKKRPADRHIATHIEPKSSTVVFLYPLQLSF